MGARGDRSIPAIRWLYAHDASAIGVGDQS
jgi:hypothetical protein